MESSKDKIKVTRKRRRLYEGVKDDIPATHRTKVPPKTGRKAVQAMRRQQAVEIVGKHAKIASATCLLPPVLDLVAIRTVGVKMTQALCRHYGIADTRHRALSIFDDLADDGKPLLWTASLAKLIPVLGPPGGGVAVLCRGTCIIDAVGQALTEHFESGGTLYDFDLSAIAH